MENFPYNDTVNLPYTHIQGGRMVQAFAYPSGFG